MSSVRLDRGGLQVDDEYVPLIAGEFEFWRHNPEHWRPILREIKALGCQQIATFICWDFHETSKHNFVFTDPTNHMRSLTEFLETVASEGMGAIVRPGPIIDSEWPTRGPAPDVAALERTHSVFRERAGEWLRAVSAALVPYQATRGGPIVLVQLDNEVFYPHCTEASATAADSSFHIPYDESLVLRDLKEWSQRVGSSMAEVPPRTAPLNTLHSDQQAAAFRFLSDQVADYLGWVQSSMIAAGIDVPFYSNVKQFCAYIDLAGLSRGLTGGAAGNSYMDGLYTESDFQVSAWWNGVQRATAPFHWAPELWCGRWLEWGQDTSVFEPEHYKFCVVTQAAMGLRGMNYFVLVERDDWHYSPISAIGKVREPAATAISDINKLMAQLGPDRRVAMVALPWSIRDHQLHLAKRGFDWTQLSSVWTELGAPKEDQAWWAVFEELNRADIEFDIVSTEDPGLAEYPFVVLPRGMSLSIDLPGRVIRIGDQDVGAELERAGVVSAIRAQTPHVWTSLYRGVGGELTGFCTNHTRDTLTSQLEIDAEEPPQLTWLVPPLEWAGDRSVVTLSPRSVAVFRLETPLRARQLWRHE